MLRKILLILVATVAMLALVTYGVRAETGPIGWLNTMQTSIFGSYSRKFSFLLLLMPVMVAGAVLFMVLWPDAPAALASAAESTPATYRTAAIVAVIVGVPLSWGVAYGDAWWQARSQAAGSAATYPLLDLSSPGSQPPTGANHVSVRGRLLADRVATRTEGAREVETLLPIVAPTWVEGDPVHFLVRLGGVGSGMFVREADGSFRVKVDGSVATSARAVFARMKAPLADDAIVFALAPPGAAEAAPVTTAQSQTRVVVIGAVGSAASVLFAAFCVLAVFRARREDRQGAAAAA